MKSILKFSFICSAVIFLSGCNKQYTHKYLLLHPDKIQSELAKCRKAPEYSTYCDMVKHTADEFSALLESRVENYEAFGKQVLQMQMDLGKLKITRDTANNAYTELKTKNPGESEMRAALLELANSQNLYATQLRKLKLFYSVISATMTPGEN